MNELAGLQLLESSSVLDESPLRRADVMVITSEIPWPLNTGGHIRTYHILKSLAAVFDVRLVTLVESAGDPGIQALEQAGVTVCATVAGPRNKWAEAAQVGLSLVKGEPYVMFNRHNRQPIREMIARQLLHKAPDVVYLDHLDPLSFRSLFPESKVIADLHNVYSTLTRRVAEERSWPVSVYLKHEAWRLAQMEQLVAARADALMTVSQQEKVQFLGLGGRSVHLVPNGVDCSAFAEFPVGRQHRDPVLLYLGALSWQPNARAAEFMAREVMPQVLKEQPRATLQIVGRNPGPEVEALAQLPGVELHANVPDVGVYLKQASLLTVPLDSGGGTRLKILEAFAAGLPVVSTTVGCEGIDCEHGRHLWVAERDRFAEALLEAISAPGLATEFAERGRWLAKEKYDWPVIGHSACKAVLSAVKGL